MGNRDDRVGRGRSKKSAHGFSSGIGHLETYSVAISGANHVSHGGEGLADKRLGLFLPIISAAMDRIRMLRELRQAARVRLDRPSKVATWSVVSSSVVREVGDVAVAL